MTWAIYSRVSTTDQADKGVSLESQLLACRSFAVARGWTVGEEVTDPGASGSSLKRPGMQVLVEKIRRREVSGVIVWRLDRLTRSIRDLLDLLALAGDQVGIVSVTESLDTTTPMGRFTTHLLGIIAQWERETIGARTSSAMKHIRERGFYSGGRKPPAGCIVVADGERKRLVAGPDAELVRPIWSQVLGGASLRQVADHLRAAGIPGTWTPSAARILLLSPLVSGLLVSAADQQRVREALAKRNPGMAGPHRSGRPAEVSSPLRGLLRCPACDGAMVQVRATGHGGSYRYFRCVAKAKGLCSQKDIRCEPVERVAIAAIADACRLGGPYLDLIRAGREHAIRNLQGHRQERAQLTGERDQIEARVADLVLGQQINTPAWATAMKVLDGQLARIDGRLAILAASIATAEIDHGNADVVLEAISQHAAALPTLPIEEQAEACRALLQRVQIIGNDVVLDLYQPETTNPTEKPRPGSLKSAIWLPGRYGKRTVRVRLSNFTRK